VVVGIRDIAFHQEVLDFLERDPRIDVAGSATEPMGVLKLLADVGSDAAVVCPALVTDLRHPAAGQRLPNVIVVAEEITVPILRDAIDAEARGVFAWPHERGELSDMLARATRGGSHAEQRRGMVIAVYGSRGGAGTTFVASHLAASLSDQGLSVALVDLDVDFAGLTVALGIEPDPPPRTIADLVPVVSELGPEHLHDVLYRHGRGFGALLAPPEGGTDPVPPGLYRAAVALLAAEFHTVVLHVPRALDDVVRTGIDIADKVLLVTTQDLFSLYGARRAMAALGLIEKSGRCRIVINRLARSEVTAADIARILGVRPSATVRFDGAVRRVQERGQLLPARARRAGRDLRSLARAFRPDPDEASTEKATR